MIVNRDKMIEHLGLMAVDAVSKAGMGAGEVGRDTSWPLENGRTVQITVRARVVGDSGLDSPPEDGSESGVLDRETEGSVA